MKQSISPPGRVYSTRAYLAGDMEAAYCLQGVSSTNTLGPISIHLAHSSPAKYVIQRVERVADDDEDGFTGCHCPHYTISTAKCLRSHGGAQHMKKTSDLSAPHTNMPCTWLASLPPLKGAGPVTAVTTKNPHDVRHAATNERHIFRCSSVVATVDRGLGNMAARVAVAILLQARCKGGQGSKHNIGVQLVVKQGHRQLHTSELRGAGPVVEAFEQHTVPCFPKQQHDIAALASPHPATLFWLQNGEQTSSVCDLKCAPAGMGRVKAAATCSPRVSAMNCRESLS
jgi:hypothetical protein